MSLLIDLGLETDATEDDFGVWEVKTMVAVILHLLEEPSGKVPLTTCHLLSQGLVNACLLIPLSPSLHLLLSLRDHEIEAPLPPPHPPQLSSFCRAWWGGPLHQTLLTPMPSPLRSIVFEA